MAPKTFTFDEIAPKVPSGAGVTGRPSGLPTTSGWGAVGCCARNVAGTTPMDIAATRNAVRFMGGLSGIGGALKLASVRRTPATYTAAAATAQAAIGAVIASAV